MRDAAGQPDEVEMDHADSPLAARTDELNDPPRQASPATSRPSQPFDEFTRGSLPEWALVRHRMDPAEIADVAAAVGTAFESVATSIPPGARVCLAVGSRGIDRIDEVVRAAVAWLRAAGAEVFVVPSMGSHGGATAAGQLEVLASYGITPESIGCEIRSSMETSSWVMSGRESRLRRPERLRRRGRDRPDQPRQAAHGLHAAKWRAA
jgi:hypothetical protein